MLMKFAQYVEVVPIEYKNSRYQRFDFFYFRIECVFPTVAFLSRFDLIYVCYTKANFHFVCNNWKCLGQGLTCI